MTRLFDIREPSLEALKAAPVYFRFGSNRKRVLIDALTANALLTVYGALSSDEAKAKFERMLSTRANLMRLVDFTWKKVRLA